MSKCRILTHRTPLNDSGVIFTLLQNSHDKVAECSPNIGLAFVVGPRLVPARAFPAFQIVAQAPDLTRAETSIITPALADLCTNHYCMLLGTTLWGLCGPLQTSLHLWAPIAMRQWLCIHRVGIHRGGQGICEFLSLHDTYDFG